MVVGTGSEMQVCPNPSCRATLVCSRDERVQCPYCGSVFRLADHPVRVITVQRERGVVEA
jgi:hypothetical protein